LNLGIGELETMSFMEHQIDYFSAWRVETDNGTCCVPADLVGTKELSPEDRLETLAMYLEGDATGEAPELVIGWFARLSAPGYMDCTEWSGPYETEAEASAELGAMYGDEDED
jgi:hypothetical protein